MGSAEQGRAEGDGGVEGASHQWRLGTSELVGVAGLVLYNWWVVVPVVHGMLPSDNGFFSDIEASGLPHATLLQHLDLVSVPRAAPRNGAWSFPATTTSTCCLASSSSPPSPRR